MWTERHDQPRLDDQNSAGCIKAGWVLLAVGTISVADIAQHLGVSQDPFYSYFP